LDRGGYGGLYVQRNRDGDSIFVGEQDGPEHRDGDRDPHRIRDSFLDGVDYLHGHCDGDAEPYGNRNRNGHGQSDGDELWNCHRFQIGDAHRIVVSHRLDYYNNNDDGHGVPGLDAFRDAVLFVHALRHSGPHRNAHHDGHALVDTVWDGHGHDLGDAFGLQHRVRGFQRNPYAHGLGLSNVLSDGDEQFDAVSLRVGNAFADSNGDGNLDLQSNDNWIENVDGERNTHPVYVFGNALDDDNLHRNRLPHGISHEHGDGLRDAQ